MPLGGVRTEIHIFVMTLDNSRRGFALGFLRERMPDLLAAQRRDGCAAVERPVEG